MFGQLQIGTIQLEQKFLKCTWNISAIKIKKKNKHSKYERWWWTTLLPPFILKRKDIRMSNNLCASPKHLKNTAKFGGKKAMKHALNRAAKRIKELQFENYKIKQTINGGKALDKTESD